jgi:hypothetical protein
MKIAVSAADLKRVAGDEELLEIGRLAIEAELVQWRDDRMFTLRNNGLVIKERDGRDSSIIRFGPEDALRIGLLAMAEHLAQEAAK